MKPNLDDLQAAGRASTSADHHEDALGVVLVSVRRQQGFALEPVRLMAVGLVWHAIRELRRSLK